MAEILKLIPQSEYDKQSVDRIMKALNEAHAAGKITHICAATIESGDKWFTYISNMRNSDLSYAIEWLKFDMRDNMKRLNEQ